MSAPLTFPVGRGARTRLGACLLLAVLTTFACKLLLGSLLGPGAWARFFYVSWLLPPALVGFWCMVLIPRETRAMYLAARSHPSAALLLALALLLASAAVLISCTDLAFEWGRVSARLKRDVVLPSAWVTNVLILFCAYALVFAATSRVAAVQLLVSPAYVVLTLATLAKIKYMHVALQPLDLLRLPEFIPLFGRFFGGPMIVAAVLALAALGCRSAGGAEDRADADVRRASRRDRRGCARGVARVPAGIRPSPIPSLGGCPAQAGWGRRSCSTVTRCAQTGCYCRSCRNCRRHSSSRRPAIPPRPWPGH